MESACHYAATNSVSKKKKYMESRSTNARMKYHLHHNFQHFGGKMAKPNENKKEIKFVFVPTLMLTLGVLACRQQSIAVYDHYLQVSLR